MSKSLGLSIPELQKPKKDAFDMRPKQVDEWLNDLPKANIGETAKQIFEALAETNNYNYHTQHRIHFLESSRETVFYVTQSMKRHFVGVNAPLPAKNQRIASATKEIHHSMATGYMIAIEGILSNSIFFSDTKTLALLIHRAIVSLTHVLLTSYQTYSPYPSGIWSELHKLYLAAETRKIASMHIVDELYPEQQKTTITKDYIRLLLLALTSPYRLRHGEVGKVYDVLQRWTSKCKLRKIDNERSISGAKFGVNLASDHPPRAAQLATDKTDHEFCRIMDSNDLTKSIRKDIKNGFKAGESTITSLDMQHSELSQDLMKRLLISWCIVPKRAYSRTEHEEKISVTLGLTSTHQIIISGSQKQAQQEELYSREANYESSQVESSLQEVQPDVWDMIYYPSDIEGFESLEEQFNKENSDSEKKSSHSTETWLILNESAQGYCVRNLNKTEGKAQVGELVGIHRSNNQHTWKWGVGVIRWLKTEEQDRLLLGIEMLTPDAAPIGVRAINNAKHDYQRTLMLPELKAVNQPTTLITSATNFRASHKLIINILGKEIMIKLTKQLQNTGLFAQYQFDILEQQDVNNKTDEHNENEPDFSGVWTSI